MLSGDKSWSPGKKIKHINPYTVSAEKKRMCFSLKATAFNARPPLFQPLTSSYFLFIFFNTSSIQVTTYFAIFYEYFDYFWADLWQILVVKVNFVGREEEKVRASRS